MSARPVVNINWRGKNAKNLHFIYLLCKSCQYTQKIMQKSTNKQKKT